VRALAFDMFGTVVDWRGSIVAEGQALGSLHGIQADWETFADGWRARYQSALDAVNQGRRPWAKLEDLSADDRERLAAGWHRLAAWPDAAPGWPCCGAGSCWPPCPTGMWPI
jgi:2-haloacid dehalogenase